MTSSGIPCPCGCCCHRAGGGCGCTSPAVAAPACRPWWGRRGAALWGGRSREGRVDKPANSSPGRVAGGCQGRGADEGRGAGRAGGDARLAQQLPRSPTSSRTRYTPAQALPGWRLVEESHRLRLPAPLPLSPCMPMHLTDTCRHGSGRCSSWGWCARHDAAGVGAPTCRTEVWEALCNTVTCEPVIMSDWAKAGARSEARRAQGRACH